MAYQALYRTWRPQRFEDVVGQEMITKTLRNAVMTNQTSHAYLFTGPGEPEKRRQRRFLPRRLTVTIRKTANHVTNAKFVKPSQTAV